MLVPKKIDFPQIQHMDGLSPKDYCWFSFGDDEQIELFDRGSYTEIVCSVQPGGVAKNRYWRMIEAIEFAFGQSIYPCAIETREGPKLTIELSSTIRGLQGEGQLPPPVELKGKVHHYPVTDLVRKFYRYVLPYVEEFPPLIAQGLWGMRQAADAQPDVKGLVFATAAETLIEACFPTITPVPKAFRKMVRALQSKIRNDGEVDPDLRERAANKLNGLTDLPNSTKIRDFLRWHVRSEEHQDKIFTDWSKLRNSAAHGTKATESFEETLRRINVTHDLCYVIVLSRIGFFHPSAAFPKTYRGTWSIAALKGASQERPSVGLTIAPSSLSWQVEEGKFSKTLLVGNDPGQSICLFVRALHQENGLPLFRIEFSPQSLLPDDLAKYQIKTDYGTSEEARNVCDELALRALLHISLEHFS
jgi:hypothetical protein